jgi:hypothetical protein
MQSATRQCLSLGLTEGGLQLPKTGKKVFGSKTAQAVFVGLPIFLFENIFKHAVALFFYVKERQGADAVQRSRDN